MAAWPSSLPDKFLQGGFVETWSKQSLKSEMDVGFKIRRRTSQKYGMITANMLLTQAQLATFETFYDETLVGGSLTFTHEDPLRGGTKTFSFNPGTEPQLVATGGGYARVTVSLIRYP